MQYHDEMGLLEGRIKAEYLAALQQVPCMCCFARVVWLNFRGDVTSLVVMNDWLCNVVCHMSIHCVAYD